MYSIRCLIFLVISVFVVFSFKTNVTNISGSDKYPVIYVWVWIQMQKLAYSNTSSNVRIKFQKISKWTEQHRIQHCFPIQIQHPPHWPLKMPPHPVGTTLMWVQATFLETSVTRTCQCLKETRLISAMSSKDCLYTFTRNVHCQFIHICHTTYISRTDRT